MHFAPVGTLLRYACASEGTDSNKRRVMAVQSLGKAAECFYK